jgi:hypothetical protein
MTVLTFSKLIDWTLARRKILFAFAFGGFIAGITALSFFPEKYEASFIVKVPIINSVDKDNKILPKGIQFVPDPVELKKHFLRPEAFSFQTLKACGFGDSNTDRKELVKSIVSEVTEYGSATLVVVRLPSKDRVFNCANALMSSATLFLDQEKNLKVDFLKQFNLNQPWLVNLNARIAYGLRISDKPVSPNAIKLVLGIALAIFLSGLWILVSWTQVLRVLGTKNHS